MSRDSKPLLDDSPEFTPRRRKVLASPITRFLLLIIALVLVMPVAFTKPPGIGLDPSWTIALQLAIIEGKVFGRDFIFTYGPLGYLFIHTAVCKWILLLYDLFVLGSLLSIFRKFLPSQPTVMDVINLFLLAAVTKICWWFSSTGMVFAILCFWLWRVMECGSSISVVNALVAAVALFFGKVNYGLILLFLVPAYGIALLLLHPRRRACAISLLLSFPILLWLGAVIWHVAIPGYLRSSMELIVGYNEAMFEYAANNSPMVLAFIFLLAIGIVACLDLRKPAWRDQALFLPLVLLAVLLLFKNGFVRSDEGHQDSFFVALPLILAIWCIGRPATRSIKPVLVVSLFCPLIFATLQRSSFKFNDFVEVKPFEYLAELIAAPQNESTAHLESVLRKGFGPMILPDTIQTMIGHSTVDVMPWESSIIALNGLNYHPRPVPQSYLAYTPWLDRLNAEFLRSTNAPDYILYACTQMITIDGRPAGWDESVAKMALLENYTEAASFELPLRVLPFQVFLLKHTPHARQFVPLSTNAVSLDLGQPIQIPATTNLIFLTLEAKRSLWGKLAAAVLPPKMLIACFQYQDGAPKYYRAVLPILKTGVLINRRLDTGDETYHWLRNEVSQNASATSLDFKTHEAWAFQTPFTGYIVEYRLVESNCPSPAQ